MIRKITLVVLALYLVTIAVFCLFGVQIRQAIAPVVQTVYPEPGSDYGTYLVPLETVNNGKILVAELCFDYPEPSFTAVEIKAVILEEANGYAQVRSNGLNYESLIILNAENLKDGQYVIVE